MPEGGGREAPLVSAVMAVRDGERFLPDSIPAIVGQDYENLELIVIENGSTDRSLELARELAPGADVSSHPVLDLASGRNEGVRRSRGALIAHCDADDVWPQGRVRALVEALAERPGAGLVYGAVETFHCPQLPEQERRRLQPPSGPVRGRVAGSCIYRREVFDEVGPFEPEQGLAEFGEWLLRVGRTDWQQVAIDRLVLRRRLHTASLTFTNPDRGDYARALAQGLRARAAERRAGGG